MKRNGLLTNSPKLRAAVVRTAFLLLGASSATGTHGPAAAASITRFEETSAHLNSSEEWFEVDGAGQGVALSGGLAAYSRANGATATFGFRGTGVRWIGLPCEMCGIAEVYMDGVYVETIDTFGPGRPGPPETMFAISDLPAGSHTLTIQVSGTWNSSSSDAEVYVDAFDVEGLISGNTGTVTRFEEHDQVVTYTGTWWLVIRPDVSGGTCLKGEDPGSTVTFNFNGTGVTFIGFKGEVTGIVLVFLDGVLVEIADTYASTHLPQQVVYSAANLPAGPHVLTLQVTGTYNASSCCAWIAIDAFDVTSAPSGGGRRGAPRR